MEEKYKDIKPFKRWHEYTESERRILPPIPEYYIRGKETPYMWMGDHWEFIMGD